MWDRTCVDGPHVILTFGPADPETGERPVTGEVEGYHLNVVRSRLPAEAATFEVDPEPHTPACTFAGDERGADGRFLETAFLRFVDEAEARAVLAGLCD